MKTTIAILLLTVLFSSCETETANLVTPPHSSDTDVPCLQFIPIIANQHDTIGDVVIYSGSGGIAIQINEINANVNTMHIKFSEIALTGNIAPGQFPIHITDPAIPFYKYFTWQEMNLSDNLQNVFVYIHFDTNIGTAWAGNIRRSGRGQWYYYTDYDLCH
jgi:hypothetical protein